jgi:cytoskeletal protein CcmA (bactofilin family)
MFKETTVTDRPAKNVETIIGPSVKVEGDFSGDGDVIVEGIVMGNLRTKNHLKVGKDAKVRAEVTAQSAFIAGEVNGNITVEGEISLTSSAKIKGDISAAVLAVEKGAKINGKISMNGQDKKVEAPTTPVNKEMQK